MSRSAPPSLKAAPSSFYWAMRLLPATKRDAMFAVYAFCREVDDIADGNAPETDKLAALNAWRERIDAIFDGAERSQLSDVAADFALAKADMVAVIDGMETDAGASVRMADEVALDLYMDRVASAVGRLSDKVFGLEGPAAETLAHHMGRALQLTNILRDVGEDAALDRLYVPLSLLRDAGVKGEGLSDILADPKLPTVLVGMAVQARHHYGEADAALKQLDRTKTRPARIMKAVYQRLLDKLEARGWQRFQDPVRLSKPEKLMIALKEMVFG